MARNQPTDYQALTTELQTLLAELEQGESTIDQAVAQYKRGLEIVKLLENQLTAAEHIVSQLRAQATPTESKQG